MRNFFLLLLVAFESLFVIGCQASPRAANHDDEVIFLNHSQAVAEQKKQREVATRWAEAMTPQQMYEVWLKDERLSEEQKHAWRRRVRKFSPQEAAAYTKLFALPEPPSWARVKALIQQFSEKKGPINFADFSDDDMTLLTVFPEIRRADEKTSSGETQSSAMEDAYVEEMLKRREQILKGSQRLVVQVQEWGKALSFQDCKMIVAVMPVWAALPLYAQGFKDAAENFTEAQEEKLEQLSGEKASSMIADFGDSISEQSIGFKTYTDVMLQRQVLIQKKSGKVASNEVAISAAVARDVSARALEAILRVYPRCRPVIEEKLGVALASDVSLKLDFQDDSSFVLTIDGDRLLVGRRMVSEMFFGAATQVIKRTSLGETDGEQGSDRNHVLMHFEEALHDVKLGGDPIDNMRILEPLGNMLFLDQNFLGCLEFAFAHELGHRVLGRAHQELKIDERELQADKFAIVLVMAAHLELKEKQKKIVDSLGDGIEFQGMAELRNAVSRNMAGLFDEMLGTGAFLVHTGKSVETQLGASSLYGYPSLEERHRQALTMLEQAVPALTVSTPSR